MKIHWWPIYYKIEENYFKFLLISVTTLKLGISTHTISNFSLTLSVAVSVYRLPLRFHTSKYLLMRHHEAGKQSFSLVFYLDGPLL